MDNNEVTSIWDSSSNPEVNQQYNNIASTVAGGAVAAFTDLGASIWNSTAGMLGADEVNTADLLSRIDKNALAVYNENPDAVEAGSFIGGVLIPSGLALKGLGLARAGVKGFGWFSDAGRASKLAQIEEAFNKGSVATKEYNALKREFWLRGQLNNLVDNAAAEVAVLATMNAHPYMEDYIKDPGENFLKSMAFGGVLGGAVTHISDRFAVNALRGAANKSAFDEILAEYKPYHEGIPSVTKLQIQAENIKTLDSLVNDTTKSPIVKEFAASALAAEKAAQQYQFEDLAGKMLEGLKKEDQVLILNKLAEDPRFAGIDKAELWTLAATKAGTKPTYKQAGITSSTEFNFSNFFDDKQALKTRVFIPETGALTSTAEAAYLTRASVLNETPKTIMATKHDAFDVVTRPKPETGQNLFFDRTPEIDRLYLQRLAQIDSLKPQQVAKAAVAPDDLPTLNALVSWGMKNQDELSGIKVKLTREEPNFDAYQSQVIKSSGVAPSHFNDLKTYAKADSQYNLGRSLLPEDTKTFLRMWTAGSSKDKALFRQAFTAYRQGGFIADTRLKRMAKELYESSPSIQLREKLLKENADADGNVYLYRGISVSQPKGHGPIDSYTPSYNVALSFAGGRTSGVRIYKVPVDDIIGVVDNGHKELEYMVLAPTRQTEASLPISMVNTPGTTQVFSNKVKEVDFPELLQTLVGQKESVLNSMLAQGIPPESAAIRTNTPINTVIKFWESSGTKSLMDLDYEGFPFLHYTKADNLGQYLSPVNRPLALRGNKNKIPYADLSAKADVRSLDIADREIKSTFLQESNNQIAQDIGNLFFSDENRPLLDMLRQGLSNAVPGKAGNKWLQSLDSYAIDMGDFGKIASYIGKQVTHIANEASKRVITPISEAASRLVTNPAAHVEFQTALALNAELKGQRIYSKGQFWQERSVIKDGKTVKELYPATFQGKEFKVVSPEADTMLQALDLAGKDMYNFHNTTNKILGKRPLTNLGFWVPAFNPIGKHLAYVHDVLTDTVKLLHASTGDQLDEVVGAFTSANARAIAANELKIVRKGEQEYWNALSGRIDPLHTEVANVSMQHGGSSSPAIVKANIDSLSDIVQGYEHYINAGVRKLADISISDITGNLNKMSELFSLKLKDQPLTTVQRFLERKEDPAAIMRNALLGASNASEAPAWKLANQSFEFVMGLAQNTIGKVWKTVTEKLPVDKLIKGDAEVLQKIDYETLSKSLEKEGIFNPWKIFDDKASEIFQVAQLTHAKDTTTRTIHASNALAATAVLRFGDVAQPIVNAMSLPILMTSALVDRMPSTFMGVAKGTGKFNPIQAMYEGVRAMNSDNAMFRGWAKKWEAEGYFKPIVSEASDILTLSRRFEPGAVAAVERAVNSNLVNTLAKPADYSEALVRKTAMFTGGVIAKRLYPELDDVGVTIFARDFMDKAVGNYHAAQRPTSFQGTLGVAAGLFQTYMLTLGQRIYRHLQLKDYKALGAMALAQSSIFGMGSLPGFNLISKAIGENFSDDNVDLTTGTFRALPDPVANMVLYGLPSSMGPAFYSRGEISPRAPTTLGELPAFSILSQAVQGIGRVIKAAATGNESTGKAMAEALSMQSINRPIARISELASGYSVTQQGSTIGVPDDVWTPMSAFVRVIGTRPLEEAKLRDAIHLSRYYGSIDHEERQKLIADLKQGIRTNSLTEERIARLAEEYLRTGSPQGWRAAVNQAVSTSEVSGAATLMTKLKSNNPLMYMIDGLDGVD